MRVQTTLQVCVCVPLSLSLPRPVQADSVTSAAIAELLAATMERTRKQKFIISGFPRSAEELAVFQSAVGPVHNWLHIDSPKVGVCAVRVAVCVCDAVDVSALFSLGLFGDF